MFRVHAEVFSLGFTAIESSPLEMKQSWIQMSVLPEPGSIWAAGRGSVRGWQGWGKIQ
eukprot:COSAG04_NODE_420_length_14643_cov_3.634007_10_plen_58_part_00